MNIREIAKKAGVSPATVSRYLTGAEVVSEATSDKIEKVMSDVEYKIKPKAQIKKSLVGVLIPNLECGFYSDILHETMQQMSSYNFQVVFIPNPENKYTLKTLLQKLKLEGLIFLEENIDGDVLKLVDDMKLKTVICGAAAIGFNTAMVHINDLAAAYEGTKYLIKLGHKKIAFLTDYAYSISVGFQRLEGCRKAMKEAGLEFDDTLVRVGDVYYDVGYRLTQELLNTGHFTALFAFSDEMAIGAMNAIFDAGLSVPNDISVLGFDDLPIAERVRPALTTIHQPIKAIVKKTLDLLSDSNSDLTNIAITFPHTVCERATCQKIEISQDKKELNK